MKIIVLHGEDTEKSYERLKKFIDTAKERSWEVAYLDESPQSFEENISSTSLFGKERFFILQNQNSLGKHQLEWLKKKYTGLPGNLIIYHSGDLSTGFLKGLPRDAKIEVYDLPKILWNFLDNIYPGHGGKLVVQLHKLIEKDSVELIFSLIARQIGDLYWAKTEPLSLPYQTWRVGKLKHQAERFEEGELIDLIEKLSQIDINVKTGKSDLVSSLDLLFITNLK